MRPRFALIPIILTFAAWTALSVTEPPAKPTQAAPPPAAQPSPVQPTSVPDPELTRKVQELQLTVQAQADQIAALQARMTALEKPKAVAATKPAVHYVQASGSCANGSCGQSSGRRGRWRR